MKTQQTGLDLHSRTFSCIDARIVDFLRLKRYDDTNPKGEDWFETVVNGAVFFAVYVTKQAFYVTRLEMERKRLLRWR